MFVAPELVNQFSKYLLCGAWICRHLLVSYVHCSNCLHLLRILLGRRKIQLHFQSGLCQSIWNKKESRSFCYLAQRAQEPAPSLNRYSIRFWCIRFSEYQFNQNVCYDLHKLYAGMTYSLPFRISICHGSFCHLCTLCFTNLVNIYCLYR